MTKTEHPAEPRKRPVPLPCACAGLRRAARVATRYYDAALRPTGLQLSQFTLLQALHIAPGITQKQLAAILEIDSTTLTRTLATLRRKKWLQSETGFDRRETRHSLTSAGKREFDRAVPYWENAQAGLKQALGKTNWKHLLDTVSQVAGIDVRSHQE